MSEENEPVRYTGHLIRRAQQRHAALWQEQVSPQVSSVQYAALAVLARMPGASQSELGAALDLDRSTIADIVFRLAQRGVVERRPHASDRRRYSLYLTAAGESEVELLRPRVVAANAMLTDNLSADELLTLRSLLKRMLQSQSA